MGKGVVIISEIQMVLSKKAFEHKKIHCYTTSLFSSSNAELYFDKDIKLSHFPTTDVLQILYTTFLPSVSSENVEILLGHCFVYAILLNVSMLP